MGNLKAIFLDADGTLVNHKECEKQALMHLFASIGVVYKDDYQDIFRPLDNELWENECYKDQPVQREDIPVYRFKILFELINIQYDDYAKANDLFKEGLASSTALMENAVELVEKLYGEGFILCVVTNGLIELQRPRIVNSRIGRFISHIIVSEEVGAHKPNPLIFNELLKRLQLNPEDVIMVGDSLRNDIQGAANAKIKSIWFNPKGMKNETDISPDYEVNCLLDVVTKILAIQS